MVRAGAEIIRRKPKASDYIDVVQALILRAASEYESLISTRDAFPDTAKKNKWARLAWKNAGLAAQEMSYPLLDSISLLVSAVIFFCSCCSMDYTQLRNRGSRIRGLAVSCVRSIVSQYFGFKRGTSDTIKASNVALYKSMKTDAAFHYKVRSNYDMLKELTSTALQQDPLAQTGFCQGKIMSEVLNTVWFDGKRSPGVIFDNLFNPIPLETLAFIFTVVRYSVWTFTY